ncbi:Mu-like prophage tail protein gpP [Roseomonas rosea]|uniref:Mu-like prophage tail protein gpP n=1 Tax=Muricoccus roseus TaxID=198092 RepID=A0A1M6LDL8_9PROT|nr:hypothetical protein [Roseomonas rosea]SHJ69303.1 Mu-like prophage tail protein gpP [Roseomonas rosea]
MPARDGDLKLLVDGQELLGWQEVRVTRGLERTPPDFLLQVNERFPAGKGVIAKPGLSCVVKIGDDTVLTGWVDRYTPGVNKRSGSRRTVSGRGKTQDLVDCSAYLRGLANQVSNAPTRQVIEQLCALFGIEVDARDGDGQVVPQFNVILTERCWDIVDRVARHSEFLAYEGTDGRLILTKLGKDTMASGFREGINVEDADVSFAYDQRYSLYEAVTIPTEILGDTARALNSPDYNLRARVTDDAIGVAEPTKGKRFRPLVLIAETMQNGVDIALKRVQWERARRIGRSQAVTLVCDSWRDAAGRLWEPGFRAPVHLPSLGLLDKEWVIAEVTYRRGSQGTLTDVTLMPEDAFLPEPILLAAFDAQLDAALNERGMIEGGGGPIP